MSTENKVSPPDSDEHLGKLLNDDLLKQVGRTYLLSSSHPFDNLVFSCILTLRLISIQDAEI